MKTKKEYISPALKVLAVNTEKGFATSTLMTLHLFHDMEYGHDADNADQQTWSEDNTVFGGISWN